MRRNFFFPFFIVFLLMPAGQAFAYHPLATEDAAVIDKGHYELEISQSVTEDPDENHVASGNYIPKAGLPGRTELDFTVPVIYGLRYRKENEEEGGYDKKASQGGFGDLELLAKWLSWSESKHIPASAVAGKVRFPSGDSRKGLGEPKASYETLYALSKTLKRLILHANIGWRFNLNEDDDLLLRTAADYEFTEKWHAVLEWDGRVNHRGANHSEGSGILTGLIWEIHPRVTADTGIRVGLDDEEDRFQLTTGLTFPF